MMDPSQYQNRTSAGRTLAALLAKFRDRDDVVILALPRGGLPVAHEIAAALSAPLDVILVRKLGLPGNRELAMGAIASGGVCVRNRSLLQSIDVSEDAFQQVENAEREELHRRERVYRGERPFPDIKGKCAVLVDDGLATGSTMRAALAAVRTLHPSRVVVAVPVGSPDSLASLEHDADEVICPLRPHWFLAIGQFYSDFSQVSDDEVRTLLDDAHSRHSQELDGSSSDTTTPPGEGRT